MPGPNRGALPLALLIVAALAAGIVVAVMRLDEQKKEKAGPVIPSPEPTLPSPTLEPTTPSTPESPISPEPTDESPSPKPTTEPTESPTPEPSPTETDGGGNGGGRNNGDVLAQTGGPILPYFLGGALMLAGSAGLWRLRRRFD